MKKWITNIRREKARNNNLVFFLIGTGCIDINPWISRNVKREI